MKKLVLLSLLLLSGMSYVGLSAEKKTEQQLTEKKPIVEAVTTATPLPKENQLIITGTVRCTSCDLKKQKGAKSQCDIYGCSYSLKTKEVMNPKGQLVKAYIGRIYQILANNNSSALLQKEYKSKDVIIVGKIYPEENVLEIDFVKLAPAR